ncbi:hypothetical protein M434DRAFT_18248 [Hypoxylon sp. CO27-5]|nr:hypothetical protein M434DRAFT_18248 [Hypoxylon sp. CO27-5]
MSAIFTELEREAARVTEGMNRLMATVEDEHMADYAREKIIYFGHVADGVKALRNSLQSKLTEQENTSSQLAETQESLNPKLVKDQKELQQEKGNDDKQSRTEMAEALGKLQLRADSSLEHLVEAGKLLKEELARKTEEINGLKEELQRSRDAAEESRKTEMENIAAVSTLEGRLSEANSNAAVAEEQANVKLNNVQSLLDDARLTIASYKEVLGKRDDENVVLQSGIENRDNQISGLQSQVADRDVRIAGLNSNVKNITRRLQNAEVKLRHEETEARKMKNEKEEADKKIQSKENDLQQVRSLLTSSEARVKSLEDDVEKLKRDVDEKTQEVVNKSKENDLNSQNWAKAQQKLTDEVAKLKRESENMSLLLRPPQKRPRSSDEESAENAVRDAWAWEVYGVAKYVLNHRPVIAEGSSLTRGEAATAMFTAVMNERSRSLLAMFLDEGYADRWYCFEELAKSGYSYQLAFIREDGTCRIHEKCLQVQRGSREDGPNSFVCRMGGETA